MDFIRYNPAEEPLLAYDDSSDKMVLDDLVSQYGEVQMFVDIDTIRVSELQSTEIEEEMKYLVELKRFKKLLLQNIRNMAWIK
ncbi:hypothetical protein G6F37_008992 [Rhizopus arrhizus]|nr:hypothetical protein G6F38_009035 [Rhizopus arrhizus]KAG1154944.1 hypothetical protein G6F37_008992 [Rhizopus arrhizus]